MNEIAARLQATLHVFLAHRSEKGQTTAEYVGIVAFVALLVVALMGTTDIFGSHVNEIIGKAFDKISSKLG